MKAVILAAGKSTRLRPYSEILPKPLMPIGVKDGIFLTSIERLIYQIRRAGIAEFYIITNYLEDSIKTYLGDGSKYDIKIEYATQKVLDGNGGAYYLVQDKINDDVIISDCDNYIEDEEFFIKLVESHKKENADISVGIAQKDNPSKYAIIEVENDTPTNIVEKPSEPKSNLAKSGVLLLSQELANMDKELSLAPNGEYTTTQMIKYGIDNGKKVHLEPMVGGFNDIGTWDEYIGLLKRSL